MPRSKINRMSNEITIRLDKRTIDYFRKLSIEAGLPIRSLISLHLRDCAEQRFVLKPGTGIIPNFRPIIYEKKGKNSIKFLFPVPKCGLKQKQEAARISKKHRDFDRFAGSWSAEQARDFDNALTRQRKIDPELRK